MTNYIYGLLDPRNEEIRYVGKTCNPQARLREHLRCIPRPAFTGDKAKWLRELNALGLLPELVLIEEVAEDADWGEREDHWMHTCRSAGHRLTNSLRGGIGGPQGSRTEQQTFRWWTLRLPYPVAP